MKTIVIVVVTTILIISLGFFNLNYLYNEADSFSNELSKLHKVIDDDNWKAANAALDKINDKWKVSHKKYLILIDHYEIDNINLSLSELNAYIKTKNKSLALAKLSTLELLIKHIPDKEALNFENIL